METLLTILLGCMGLSEKVCKVLGTQQVFSEQKV